VNTDGKVDVSDALAVVQFLFLGEPEVLQPHVRRVSSPGVTPAVSSTMAMARSRTRPRAHVGQRRGPPSHWQDAVSYCDALNLAGHDDWRLPNSGELFSSDPVRVRPNHGPRL
jgi:hypothetical protein